MILLSAVDDPTTVQELPPMLREGLAELPAALRPLPMDGDQRHVIRAL